MTDAPEDAPIDEHGIRLLAVVNLLAEMAVQTLKKGDADGARGFVDCIDSLQHRTRGNTGPDENAAFEQILHGLRLAIVKGPPPPEEPETPAGGDA